VRRYALARLLALVPVLLGMSIIVFLVMSLVPGDPALAILGPYASADNVARLHRELGLDRPLPLRYLAWLGGVLGGDLGHAYSLDRPVLAELRERAGATAVLAGAALMLGTLPGLLAGVLSAVCHNRWQDRLLTVLVLIGISTPSFWLGLVLILVFAVGLGWLPVSGMSTVWGPGGAADLLRHLLLPALALAAVAGAVIARLTRAAMLEALQQDYIHTARSKGLGEARVVCRHALRNAVIALIPVIGLQAGFVLGGAVYIETVFEWPGLGRMLVQAIATRDLLLVQGGVLVLASAYVLINLVADLVQYALDPRLQLR